MKETIELLVRLQELEYILSEQLAAQEEASSPGIREEIARLAEQLPSAAHALFKSLRQRHLAAVVPLNRNACSGCGFAVPTSQVGAVQEGSQIQQCRNCRRILYSPDEILRQKRTGTASKLAMQGLERFSSPSLMIPALESDSRDAALGELIECMAGGGLLEDSPAILERALERERAASTALPGGLAFPHVRGVEGGGMAFALGLSNKGLKFDSTQRELTRIIFFSIIPTAASSLYLRLVADLLGPLRDRATRKALLSCTTEQALWRQLRSVVEIV